TLTVNNGGNTIFNISNDNVTMSGAVFNMTNLDTFSTLDSTVIFDGEATTQALTSGGRSLESIQLGTSSAGAVVATGDNLTYTGTLLVRNGGATTFNITNDVVTTAGTMDFTNLDTFTTVDSTVIFNGGAVTQAVTSGTVSFESVQVGTASAGAVIATSGNISVT